jgi:uncharacterized damage-inducible protein DinB
MAHRGGRDQLLACGSDRRVPLERAERPETIRTPADAAAWYADRFRSAFERLQETSGEQLLQPIDFYGIRHIPALSFVQIGINHTIHHRGQLSTYLRPMGAKVPSIYGESYDAREARERAQRIPRPA